MAVMIYSIKTKELKTILKPVQDRFLKIIALNKEKKNEIAIYYPKNGIFLYDIVTTSEIHNYNNFNDLLNFSFNIDDKLLVLNEKNEIFIIDIKTHNITQWKVCGKPNLIAWYPFNKNDFVYSNNKQEIYLCNKDSGKKYINYIEVKTEDNNNIVELQWYNSDENYKYLLVGFQNTEIILCDMNNNNPSIIMKFDKHGNSLNKIIWLKNEPGSFISTLNKSTKITYWNVSKKSYKSISKLTDVPLLNSKISQNGNEILMSLENGEIEIYDTKLKKIIFSSIPSHTSTIFDLEFSPFKYGQFATVSYDGSLKIWDMTKDYVLLSLKINEPRIINNDDIPKMYSVKYSPINDNLILTGDSKRGLRIWDIDLEKNISSIKLGNEKNDSEVIGIDWNEKNDIIASCDNSIFISTLEGGKIMLISEVNIKVKVFQIKFSPYDDNFFAVACEDSFIRIYDKNHTENSPKQLSGHTQKVFGLAYNPKNKILASSSDDFKIGIWNLDNKDIKGKFLLGHTNNVRQIIWIKEDPNKLISGSWDQTSRIWDTKYMICVGLISGHYSDIYGIDVCPNHPFLLITSSKDNSIRFWNYVRNPIEFIVNFNHSNCDIYNKYKSLEKKLESVKKDDFVSRAETIVNFFFYNDYIKELFDILRVILGLKEHNDDKNKMFYIADLYSAYKSKISNLEFNYYNNSMKISFKKKKEDLLNEAIDNCAKCGDWEKYCELNIALNNWKKAIIAAPHVSIKYWEELTKKYSEYLLKNENEDINISDNDKLFASLNSNEFEPSLKLLSEKNLYEDAKMVWLNKMINKLKSDKKNNNINDPTGGFFTNDDNDEDIEETLKNLENDSKLKQISNEIAKDKLSSGNCVQAACAYLSIKQVNNAIKCLIRGNELEIAYLVIKLTNSYLYEYDVMFGLLCQELKFSNYNKQVNVIENCQNENLNALLYSFLLLFGNLQEKEKEIYNNLKTKINGYCKIIIENDYETLNNNIQKLYENFDKDLEKNEINENNILEYLDILEAMRVINWEKFKNSNINLYNQVYQNYLILSLFFEMLNHNLKSISILCNELEKNGILPNSNLLIPVKEYYKKNNKDKEILTKFQKSSNIDLEKLQNTFNNFNNERIKKYSCENMKKFYIIKDELFKNKISNIVKSSVTGNIITGKISKIGDFNLLNSEVLELFKIISVCSASPKNFHP